MSRHIVSLLLAVVLLSAGCVASLQPIFTNDEAFFDESLLGTWHEDASNENERASTWKFSQRKEMVYQLDFTNAKGKQGRFKAHFAKVQGKTFLDLQPEDTDKGKHATLYDAFTIQAHGFLYVEQTEPTLVMRMLDYGWLETLLKQNPEAIQHVVVDKRIILTASTSDLQAFAVKHLETKGAYGEPLKLQREKPTVPDTKANGS